MKKLVCGFLSVGLLLSSFNVSIAKADEVTSLKGSPEVGDVIVTVGADLTEKQRFELLNKFNVVESDTNIVKVTIDDEKEYLGSYVSKERMGNKSYSNSKIEILKEGSGIDVSTSNISWVSEAMYANALLTAGVQDAKIEVTAPFEVSGTGALTGIIKAYDSYEDVELNKEQIDIANEEMVTSAEISDEIGVEEADALLVAVKELIMENEYKNKEDLEKDILIKAEELGIAVGEESLNKLVDLYYKMSELDIDWSQFSEQYDKLKDSVLGFVNDIDKEQVKEKAEEAKGFFTKVLDGIGNVIDWFLGLFGYDKTEEEVTVE